MPRQLGSWSSKNILAGDVPPSKSITILNNLQMAAGTVLGKVSATSFYKAYSAVAVDGSEVAVGILVDKIDSTAGQEGNGNAVCISGMYETGMFYTDQLVGMDALALRQLGGAALADNRTLLGCGRRSKDESVPGDLTVGDDLIVTDDASVGGALTVVESVTAADLIATDDLTVGDDASVGGALTVTESVTAADLIATDDLTVGDDASVGGALTVTESVTAADLIATDDLTVGDDAAIGGDLAVTGNTTNTGLTTMNGGQAFTATAPADAAYTVLVTDDVILFPSAAAPRIITMLPAATYGLGRVLKVGTVNADAQGITVDGDAAETINGAANFVFAAEGQSQDFIAIAGGWRTI